jgi:tetratricopeptide (TPR) repeat protein
MENFSISRGMIKWAIFSNLLLKLTNLPHLGHHITRNLLLGGGRLLQELEAELKIIDSTLRGLSMEAAPLKWGSLMNLKAVLLRNLERYREAEQAFLQALKLKEQPEHRAKVLINLAKLYFFKGEHARALEVLGKVFELAKAQKRFPMELQGYAHLLRGQAYNRLKDEQKALAEFRKAEYFFEGGADARGVGLACLELARHFIKAQDLKTAWNFLKKAEMFLQRLGAEERLGVAICKAVALYYSGKEQEAMELLKGLYEEHQDMGKGLHTIDEIIDAYLSTRSRMLQYQKALV